MIFQKLCLQMKPYLSVCMKNEKYLSFRKNKINDKKAAFNFWYTKFKIKLLLLLNFKTLFIYIIAVFPTKL